MGRGHSLRSQAQLFISFRPSWAISKLSIAASLAYDVRSSEMILTGKQRVNDHDATT